MADITPAIPTNAKLCSETFTILEALIILEKVNPKIPPAKSEGAKTPPIPPEAVVKLLAIIFRN